MTNFEALLAEIEPYSASTYSLSKRLLDRGVSDIGEYTPANKRTIALCAVETLSHFLSLASENTGRVSQSYNKEGLEDMIKALCKDNDIDVSEYIEVPTVVVTSIPWL